MNYKKQVILSLTIATLTTINTIIPQLKTRANQPQNKQTTTQTKASDWFYQGVIKINREDYEGAIFDFSKAIEINPRYAAAYYRRGLIYAQYAQGKILNSDGTLPGCVRIDEYSVSCEVKITANWKKQNKQQAIEDFNSAIAIIPRYAAAYHQRGFIQENRQDKLNDFQVAIDIYHSQALTYLNLNNGREAAKLLDKIDELYLQINPEEAVIESRTGSPQLSAELKKSPHTLMNEGRQALSKSDLSTALRKYRIAARIFINRKDSKRYKQVQQIIRGIERKAKR